MTKRLLVIDDELNLLEAVAAILRRIGYEVATARSGQEALVRLAESLPDLIISDIRMPGIDGYALARHLRTSPRTNLIPIVFLTALSGTADRIASFRTGIDAYLTKPFEPEELFAVIASILDRMQRTQAEFARRVCTPKVNESYIRDEELTAAEKRVAQAIARSLSNKEIALEIGIGVRTVETHISRILAKKGWSNRVDIARFVIERTSNA